MAVRCRTLAFETVSAEVVQLWMTVRCCNSNRQPYVCMLCACKLSWPFVRIQTPRKLPKAVVMTANIKRHCEELSTVKDQLTQQLHFLIILGVKTTSQTAAVKLEMC